MSKLDPWDMVYKEYSHIYTEEQVNEMTFVEIMELLSYDKIL